MHHDAAHCTSESEFTRFGAGFIAPPESRPVVQHGSLGETKIFRLIFVSGSVDSLVGEDLLVRGVDLLPSFARKKNFEKKKLQHSTCISRGLPSALRGCCGSSVGCFGVFFFNFLLSTSLLLQSAQSHDSYLVDPASSHMLVSKIKPCMSKFTLSHGETANGSLNQSRFLR